MFLITLQRVVAQIGQDELHVPKTDLTSDSVAIILHIVFGVAGGIALIVVIITGMQYTLSLGNPQATNKAKNALIYALIGLAVCVAAFSLVSFILRSII